MALRETSVRPPQPWLIRWEIFAVLAVSLGASALNALLSLIGSLLAKQSLSSQRQVFLPVGEVVVARGLDAEAVLGERFADDLLCKHIAPPTADGSRRLRRTLLYG